MSDKQSSGLRYQDAGVDIAAGNRLVNNIKPLVAKTMRPEVLTGLGGFAGLFALDIQQYQQPILVSATDGVGTKLQLAMALQCHDTIGIDLVAMCVNDLLVCGASPLFFLDYYATSKLQVEVATEVIAGIAEGCRQAGAALIGGETAEMPGMYQADDYDLAGFCVGIVDKAKLIDNSKVAVGDKIIGLAASGPHSNGYSLIRKIIGDHQIDLAEKLSGVSLGELLLQPTRIYVQVINVLLQRVEIHAMAHITGGGFYENIPRVLPSHTAAMIDASKWPQPEIFTWLQQQGKISQQEMFRTFNNGIGMVLIVPESAVELTLQTLNAMGETAWLLGDVQASTKQNSEVIIDFPA